VLARFRTPPVPDTIESMDARKIEEMAHFSSEKMQKVNLFESPRMFCDIYCLEPEQEQTVHTHDGNDKIYYVVQGAGLVTIGQVRKATCSSREKSSVPSRVSLMG
jgi:mannose-6-phosphate isomerase-like protein (cupin superfamily)